MSQENEDLIVDIFMGTNETVPAKGTITISPREALGLISSLSNQLSEAKELDESISVTLPSGVGVHLSDIDLTALRVALAELGEYEGQRTPSIVASPIRSMYQPWAYAEMEINLALRNLDKIAWKEVGQVEKERGLE